MWCNKERLTKSQKRYLLIEKVPIGWKCTYEPKRCLLKNEKSQLFVFLNVYVALIYIATWRNEKLSTKGCWYPFLRHISYKSDSTKPDFFVSSIHVLYYILFYSFKYGPSSCDLWGKLRKCGLEGMGRFLSNLLHEPTTCMLPSGQGTLVAP